MFTIKSKVKQLLPGLKGPGNIIIIIIINIKLIKLLKWKTVKRKKLFGLYAYW